jgi:hypothetical protein
LSKDVSPIYKDVTKFNCLIELGNCNFQLSNLSEAEKNVMEAANLVLKANLDPKNRQLAIVQTIPLYEKILKDKVENFFSELDLAINNFSLSELEKASVEFSRTVARINYRFPEGPHSSGETSSPELTILKLFTLAMKIDGLTLNCDDEEFERLELRVGMNHTIVHLYNVLKKRESAQPIAQQSIDLCRKFSSRFPNSYKKEVKDLSDESKDKLSNIKSKNLKFNKL